MRKEFEENIEILKGCKNLIDLTSENTSEVGGYVDMLNMISELIELYTPEMPLLDYKNETMKVINEYINEED